MPVEYRFNFPLPNGLHARPASHFESLASRLKSKITLIREKTRYSADARSVLSLISAGVRQHDDCIIEIDGEDEQPALAAMSRFITDELPHIDEALPAIPADAAEMPIPRSLAAAGLKDFVRGKPVCGGIGRGRAVVLTGLVMPPEIANQKAADPAYEKQRVTSALSSVAGDLRSRIEKARHPDEIAVLKAHASIIRDPALVEAVQKHIAANGRTAAQAVVESCQTFIETLANSQSAYLRERVLDVEDVCMQLLDCLTGGKQRAAGPVLTGPSICIAEHLTPGQLLGMDRRHLKGLVLSDGGTTSHTVILARSMNIPTLVGVPRNGIKVRAGDQVLVDGELGLVIVEPSEKVDRYYAIEQARLDDRRKQAEAFRQLEGMTADGRAVEMGANIASAEESALAFEEGAQGIGLFRTEMLFCDADAAPTEQEQTRIYTDAAVAGKGKPVIIRLLDIGGDKPAPYLKLPEEENPFLGNRGVRLYREFSALIKTQLRAIIRASTSGNIKILVPMVCCVEEVRDVKAMLDEAHRELLAEGIAVDRLPPLGAMIEVPSVAFLIPELSRELDFFSIGSNDLTQYFLAVDRGNPKVSALYTWSHPAFLRMLKFIADAARAQGKWVGLCGEMGDQPAALPLLVGLGLDEISVSVPRVSAKKQAIANCNYTECRELLERVIDCGTRAEVESVLEGFSGEGACAPLILPEMIFSSDAASKEEVIKQMTDRIYLAGRAAKPQLLEEAVWAREDVYSTGFGHGFAVPHCKSDHVSASSVVIAKLTSSIEWKSLDGNPVDVVILLAIRGQGCGNQHMRIIARLSRLVMRDEFRAQIRQENDPVQLAAFLQASLEPAAPAPC